MMWTQQPFHSAAALILTSPSSLITVHTFSFSVALGTSLPISLLTLVCFKQSFPVYVLRVLYSHMIWEVVISRYLSLDIINENVSKSICVLSCKFEFHSTKRNNTKNVFGRIRFLNLRTINLPLWSQVDTKATYFWCFRKARESFGPGITLHRGLIDIQQIL